MSGRSFTGTRAFMVCNSGEVLKFGNVPGNKHFIPVVPAQAGTHNTVPSERRLWIPAFAGMTGLVFGASLVCQVQENGNLRGSQ
jgi:hypothetical protein